MRAPTGTGKTLGVFGAWAYHRLVRRDSAWPRRLAFVLPMRVLAEQCEAEIKGALRAMGLLAPDAQTASAQQVAVHLLMGGSEVDPWHLHPEQDAVLIGTQDMLLSRALNRGYASAPGRWPMEYGLLHQDVLWVLDEVQLMDVGFATSAQLQAFRDSLAEQRLRPAHSWWMSATLQADWLEQTDLRATREALDREAITVPPAERVGGPFDAQKALQLIPISRASDPKHVLWAKQVVSAHKDAADGPFGRITLAICNTVDDAIALHAALTKELGKAASTELELVHSRFRGMERAAWREKFLSRDACKSGVDRIIVATQVVEAGVDVSATALVTQLAPWPSLVQRMGRAARYGGTASVIVIDRELDEKNALPYALDALLAAREAVARLAGDASLSAIEELEATLQTSDRTLLARLYPYLPLHVLSRREHDDLFDTEPDLTGQDLDISRFIRSDDERDVSLWWHPIPKDSKADNRSSLPPESLVPKREELCRVPVAKARDFLLKKAAEEGAAWMWDFVDGAYRPLRARDERLVYPGQTFLVDASFGGYDPALGFTGTPSKKDAGDVSHLARDAASQESAIAQKEERASLSQDDDSLSTVGLRTIATHCWEAKSRAETLCATLELPARIRDLVSLATSLHDIGKAHPVFQAAILPPKPARTDLAKAPRWKQRPYESKERAQHRPGFRHELASVLMLFEYLHRLDPYHPALLGPHRELLALLGDRSEHEAAAPLVPTALAEELSGLSASEVDLVAYLICAHHGKVRVGWRATPQDQEVATKGVMRGGMLVAPLRGVAEGDETPELILRHAEQSVELPALSLHLELAQLGLSSRYGASWTERVEGLLRTYGPHTLAYLEALLRVADVRASSECDGEDPLLREEARA